MIPVLLALLTPSADAVRPTEGGLFSFERSDEVVSWDTPSGLVRVHYSIAGPSVTLLTDADETGVPDYVEMVGSAVEDAWLVYEQAGFREPLREADLGLGNLGGSDAFDVYLVDFGGNSDGNFSTDACDDHTCAGFFVMENDFKGYGYPSLAVAVDVLASHELFHGVQYAYSDRLSIWVSEGTATWAERLYDPDSRDFRNQVESYLADCGRSLDKMPTGPVPRFAYGTGLWFDFLSLRHDDDTIVELLEELEPISDEVPDGVEVLGRVMAARDDTWSDAWTTFARYNLAAGTRSGSMESYPYAADLFPGVPMEDTGSSIVDDSHRFFPLAATYWRIQHPGGPMELAVEEGAEAVRFSVHAKNEDDNAEEALVDLTGPGGVIGEDLAAGVYWLVGTYPEPADSSAKVGLCIGGELAMATCPFLDEEPDTDPDWNDDDLHGGCGCSAAPLSGTGPLLLGIVALFAGRRRTRRGGLERSAQPPCQAGVDGAHIPR